MPTLNKVLLMGHLTSDAQLDARTGRFFGFTLAVNETWKDAQDKKRSRVDYLDCVLPPGPRFETLAPHLTSGRAVLVEGRLRKEAFDRDGSAVAVSYVEVQRVEFVGPRSEGKDPRP